MTPTAPRTPCRDCGIPFIRLAPGCDVCPDCIEKRLARFAGNTPKDGQRRT